MVRKSENAEFFAKIEYGLKLAIQRLYEQKAANNETAVVYVDGEIKHVSARELLAKQKSNKSD